jgi:NTP pyrophosphatase (non-canonical NTP hydrolase)
VRILQRSYYTEPMPYSLSQLQKVIRDTYDARDRRRGVEGTFMWFMQEIGELATALRSGTSEERAEEFADVLAWLATLANNVGIDLEAAVEAKYGNGCPGCGHSPCTCEAALKP